MEEEEIVITDEEANMELEQLLMEKGWDALFGSSDSIFFGGSDLVLTGDLSACVSSLENSYGVGLSRVDSKTLLAGAETFRLHQLEIFLVSSMIVQDQWIIQGHRRDLARIGFLDWRDDGMNMNDL